jgi:hypothetical protein
VNAGVLEAVDRIVNRGGPREDVLGAALDVLVGRGVVDWAAFGDVERGVRGDAAEEHGGVLRAAGVADPETLGRVALLVSHYEGGGSWSR